MKAFWIFLAFAAVAGCARSPGFRREAGQTPRAQTEHEREKVMESAQKFAGLRKRTVVLPFWNDTPIKGRFEVTGKNILREILLEQNRVNLVDERDISLRSQDFYLDSERLNVQHAAENGKKWGVSMIVLGRIHKIVVRRKDDNVGVLRPSTAVAAVSLEVRLVDVASGKEVALGQGAGTAESGSLNLFGGRSDDSEESRNEIVTAAIEDAVRKALPQINREIDRIQWAGKIARISGNKVYVNAGRATGLAVGDILKVSSLGQDIFDPDTGLFLGRSQGDLKGTLEVVEFFGEDGSISRVHSGGNFNEGDQVQLY
ncbi:MAG: hypothetical protein HUU37_08495 [Bdellovibrionales bacterium]|nr:hypothetical protein [Bdellovibrionales bacterium]